MTHLLDISDDELKSKLKEWEQPAFRVGQIRRWISEGRVERFDQMTDLPKTLQAKLEEEFDIWTTRIVRHETAEDGTEKLLLELTDRGRIECVLLRDGIRRTICVSSQVGCAMGCVFCASGLDGVDRNLSKGEIVEQMLRLQHQLPEDERLSHIVMMGMGEPLANLPQVVPALQWASAPQGLGISPRRITISTVGLPPAIRKLAETDSRFNLAVSLHAPNDELRQTIVPTNDKTGIDEILSAADEYFQRSSRRLTFEYVLLAGINDQTEHAQELVRRLRGRDVLINVIPYNPVAGLSYKTPSADVIRSFRTILEGAGHTIKFRQRKGDEINAACGQLRRSAVDAGST